MQRGVKVIFKLPITEVSNGRDDDGLKKFQGSREALVWMWMGRLILDICGEENLVHNFHSVYRSKPFTWLSVFQ